MKTKRSARRAGMIGVGIAMAALAPAVLNPLASADPDGPATSAGTQPTAEVASAGPGIAHAPDGRTLSVAGSDETELPIPPLTTALTAREWLVGGTFVGSGMDTVEGGTLEVGYQIGCGMELDKIFAPSVVLGVGVNNGSLSSGGLAPFSSVTFPVSGQIQVQGRPGIVITVPVDKKAFKGNNTRITVRDIHIKVDNCVGASLIRSFAVLTSSGTDADDIVAYYGTTKVF